MRRTKWQGERTCSFCGKEQSEQRRLINGPGVGICDECVQLCVEILNEQPRGHAATLPNSERHDFSKLPVEVLLDGLRRRSIGIHEAEQGVHDAVSILRERGMTWAKIGDALGVSRQSAWERYSGEE